MADNIVRICAQSDIAPESVTAFDVGDQRLAVFNIGGRFYVTDDECTHASASLAEGMLDGDIIECAVHMGAFHVPTGAGEVAAVPGGAADLSGRAARTATFLPIWTGTRPASLLNGRFCPNPKILYKYGWPRTAPTCSAY